ncbi:armadillo-type protein [Dunaliella salina]|uniref:Armadillo-type protein n=1 Tax=Dunaliella salina TaxID=3046 RepID=A0ABQ7GU70_DUNSA|nr:armadillo-type protein [Dunaliella salina]|eukprot:KAF5838163.1 armadillo-type protein [Dunaliella salina]
MVAKAQELVGDMMGAGRKETDTLAALKKIKNQIIGNKTKKKAFLECGAVPCILKILYTSTNPELQIQAAAALGSFGCGSPDQLTPEQKHDAVDALLRIIFSSEPRVVEAGVPRHQLVAPAVVARLVQLLGSAAVSVVASITGWTLQDACGSSHNLSPLLTAQRAWLVDLNGANGQTPGLAPGHTTAKASPAAEGSATETTAAVGYRDGQQQQQQQGGGAETRPSSSAPGCKDGALSPDVADAVATVLARCCTNAHEQRALTSAGAVYGLCVLLVSKRRPSQAAALAALSPLLCGNPEACLELLRPGHLNKTHSKDRDSGAPIPSQQPTSSTPTTAEQIHFSPSGPPSTSGPDTQTAAPTPAAAAAAAAAAAPMSSSHSAAVSMMSALNAPIDSWPALEALLGLLRDQGPEVRLLAASCITHLATSCPRNNTCAAAMGSHRPPSGCSSSSDVPEPLIMRLEDARRAALPVLLRLLGDPQWARAVPMVLSTLIENR